MSIFKSKDKNKTKDFAKSRLKNDKTFINKKSSKLSNRLNKESNVNEKINIEKEDNKNLNKTDKLSKKIIKNKEQKLDIDRLNPFSFNKDHKNINKENKKSNIKNNETFKDLDNRISIDRNASDELLKDLGLFIEKQTDVERKVEDELVNRELKKMVKEVDRYNKKSLIPKSKKKDKYTSKELLMLTKEMELERKKKAEDYVIIRREIENRAPIASVSIWNKFLLTFREMDRRGGWSEKKRLIEERKNKEKNLMIQSKIFKKLKEMIDYQIKERNLEFCLEIKLNKRYRENLNEVLKMDYFTIFSDIREIKHNKNYYMYKTYPPIVLVFTRDIDNDYL